MSIEVMRRSRPAFRDWNQSIEDRVSKTSKILAQMVGIKMIGAESAVGEFLQQLRQTEVTFYKKPRQLSIFTLVTGMLQGKSLLSSVANEKQSFLAIPARLSSWWQVVCIGVVLRTVSTLQTSSRPLPLFGSLRILFQTFSNRGLKLESS